MNAFRLLAVVLCLPFSSSVVPIGRAAELVKVPMFAKIESCHDGDTCTVFLAGSGAKLRVRLAGIDAPESANKPLWKKPQPLAEESSARLNSLVRGKDVVLNQVDLDRYNRSVTEIVFEGKNVNLLMLSEGLAERYRGRTPGIDSEVYDRAEREARLAKRGIWGLPRYESPQDFRRRARH